MLPPLGEAATISANLIERVFGNISDVLAHLFGILGLRHFTHLSAVNRAWLAAVDSKYKQWGVLVPVGTLGSGAGRRSGELDMPTHCSMLPGGRVVVVDSCNDRLVAFEPDGQVHKLVGRPGARRGQLSSPSGAACGPAGLGDERPALYATSLIETPGGGYGGRVHAQRCILKLSLPGFEVVQSSPLRPQETLDAPEGMAVAAGRVFVVDQGQHTIAAFDAGTLALIGFCGEYGKRGGALAELEWLTRLEGGGFSRDEERHSSGLYLNCPTDIAALDGELFVTDTHNNRLVCLSVDGACLGVIGSRGEGAGQFVYPKGVAVAQGLLYVSEERRVQVLTPLGEPRIIIGVPGAGSLGGVCTDGRLVYVTDADMHCVHVMVLRHESRAKAIAGVRAEREARRAEQDREADVRRQREAEKRSLVHERDLAIKRLSAGSKDASVSRLLGLPATATSVEQQRRARLLMRLLHPDRSFNIELRGTPEGVRIEAAFKAVGNLAT